MKTLAELAAIRESMRDKIAIRKGLADVRVVVGMGTCGIAAGAKAVLNAFVEEVNAQNLFETVTVTQSGCMGDCGNEPTVQIVAPGKDTVTYINMDADKAKKVVLEHLKGGAPVAEYMKK